MKILQLNIKFFSVISLLPALFVLGCADVPRNNPADKGGDSYEYRYADKKITSFSFADPVVNGVIDENNSSITVYVTHDTDLENISAFYETNAELVTVDGKQQRSGITKNDFTEPVIYTVTALDGSSRDYIVSTERVMVASFSVTDPYWNEDVAGTINYNTNTISINIPGYMVISGLVANFVTGSDVTVDSIVQTSGVTINDFTGSVAYEVSDANGVTQTYTVNVKYRDSVVSHLAGSLGGRGSSDGLGPDASFRSPYGITADLNNMNYFYMTDSGNNTIRKIDISTGMVTTIAGSARAAGSTDGTGSAARFNYPVGITTDGYNLYVTDRGNNTIRKIVISTGEVSTFAGYPGQIGIEDGYGTEARFFYPTGITTDGINLYVCDSHNNTIRKIVIATGRVITIAGLAVEDPDPDAPNEGSFADDPDGYPDPNAVPPVSDARFAFPLAITTDGTNLYVSEPYRVRKIVISTGVVSIIAGSTTSSGFADGAGLTSARFNYICGLATDGRILYVSDSYNHAIRQIDLSSGAVTTIAGGVPATPVSGSVDAFGNAARFTVPTGIAINGTNTNLFVTSSSHTVRMISLSTKRVSTVAGRANEYGTIDNIGTDARFHIPSGITAWGDNVYVADFYNNAIRRIIISTGAVSTIAGLSGPENSGTDDDYNGYTAGITSRFNYPVAIATDGTNLYVTQSTTGRIRKISIASGAVVTIAGDAGVGYADDPDGYPDPSALPPVSEARFDDPEGIATDGTNLYMADKNNCVIRKMVISTGVVTTFAGTQGSQGNTDGIGTSAKFNCPSGIATDGTNLYVADTWNHVIRKIVISTGVVTTIAGSKGISGTADDPDGYPAGSTVSAARFYQPSDIATDGVNLYVADYGNHTTRKVVIANGAVTTIAGIPTVEGSSDGTGSNSLFVYPRSITFDSNLKQLYVSDSINNAIRIITP